MGAVILRYLQKWHGAGNDFLVEVIEHGTAPWWDEEHVRAVCDRTTGVGADGLLLATVGSEVTMVLFNADGSRAEMSGNGIRCLAAAVRRSTRDAWDSLDVMGDFRWRAEFVSYFLRHGCPTPATCPYGTLGGLPLGGFVAE